MVTPRATARVDVAESFGLRANMSERMSRSGRQPRCAPPLSRHYEVASLTSTGEILQLTCRAPAIPVFEEAFAVFARGTLIATERGEIAVEDLIPGTMIRTGSGTTHPVLWTGRMTLRPDPTDPTSAETPRLIRLATDALGLGRPVPDLVLGPRARLLFRSARCRALLDSPEAFAPARGFVDGENVIEVAPAAPVNLYQLALRGQQTILANGIEVESYHPGPQFEAMMDRDTLRTFLGLFPHVTGPDGFGPMPVPRLTAFELETLRAA